MNTLLLADLASDASQAVQDGISAHNWLLVGAGALALIVPVVLHALGKDVPVVSPLLDGLLGLAKKAGKPAPPPPQGVADVVPIKPDPKDQPK